MRFALMFSVILSLAPCYFMLFYCMQYLDIVRAIYFRPHALFIGALYHALLVECQDSIKYVKSANMCIGWAVVDPTWKCFLTSMRNVYIIIGECATSMTNVQHQQHMYNIN